MMVFVTGGARSGKSRFAERLALERGGGVTYIATARPGDPEMRARITRHRRRRPPDWTTIEADIDLPGAISRALDGSGTVLVDCMTIFIANLLLSGNLVETDPDSCAVIDNSVDRIIDICFNEEHAAVILVSNEVGMGVVPENALGRVFRDIAGRANQRLAAVADEVYLCVSGIPVPIKKKTGGGQDRRRSSWRQDRAGFQAPAGFHTDRGKQA